MAPFGMSTKAFLDRAGVFEIFFSTFSYLPYYVLALTTCPASTPSILAVCYRVHS
jgi:hypothetical protein